MTKEHVVLNLSDITYIDTTGIVSTAAAIPIRQLAIDAVAARTAKRAGNALFSRGCRFSCIPLQYSVGHINHGSTGIIASSAADDPPFAALGVRQSQNRR